MTYKVYLNFELTSTHGVSAFHNMWEKKNVFYQFRKKIKERHVIDVRLKLSISKVHLYLQKNRVCFYINMLKYYKYIMTAVYIFVTFFVTLLSHTHTNQYHVLLTRNVASLLFLLSLNLVTTV